MIDVAHRAEIEAYYKTLNPAGDERDAREFVATVEFQFEVERRKMAEEIAALKAKIERVRGILIRVPNCCVPAFVFAKGIKDALKELD